MSRAKVPRTNLFGLRATGERFPFEATISQTNVAGERLRTVILRDTTEEKKMAQVLLRNEKLASVGRIAASIAHEINNPLAAACNLLYLARQGNASLEAVREYIDMADAELNRIVHITRQSLGFYRESNGPGPTRVSAVLESALDLLKAKIAAKKAVVVRDLSDDAEIIAVPGELRQVFCNLLANSLDAIDDGGAIRVKLSPGRDPVTSSPCVRVTVADNGAGIPVATRHQIFEPFFTTKGTIGTGLGLWVSKQLVEKHHGIIQMRSATSGPRRGATLSIRLPL
jgi:signal transduction histidine kinase